MTRTDRLRYELFDIGCEPIGNLDPSHPSWGKILREVDTSEKHWKVQRCVYVGAHLIHSEKPSRRFYVLETSGWRRREPGFTNLSLKPLEIIEGDVCSTSTISHANYRIKEELSKLLKNRSYAQNCSRLPLKF